MITTAIAFLIGLAVQPAVRLIQRHHYRRTAMHRLRQTAVPCWEYSDTERGRAA